MMRRMKTWGWLIGCVLVCASGCSNTGTVSGEVTYEGTAVEDGTITLLPADGKGPSAGGQITRGKYEVKDLEPGPRIVQIAAFKKVPFARSSEEMAKKHAEARARGNATGLIDPTDLIPPDAEGNNAPLEVKPGRQTQNFALKSPAGKKPR